MFEFSFTNRQDAIYTKSELLVDDDGKPQEMPWEDWRPGDDQHTSAWMRATAPSGAAEFEGIVAWAGELGYGVRPPEGGQPLEAEQAEAAAHAADDHGDHGGHH
jgi:NADH-quinone oxidoreductase subunit I